jgi:DNA repair exonuclease SbcCD nuclease subunit
MMTYAAKADTDLVLLSGDLFDGDLVTRETVALLARECENYGRPVFIAPGNHDPASPNSVWRRVTFPDNVHIFTSASLDAVDLCDANGQDTGVTVYGWAFTGPDLDEVPLDGTAVDDPARINLLVCHADMTDPHSSDCPLTAAHLDAFGADYAALGHIHNPPAPGPACRYAYPGCLEPRGFDERGPKGAILAEIEKTDGPSTVSLRRIRFSKRRYERADCDVTGSETSADVREAIRQTILSFARESGWGADTCAALRLTGSISPGLVLDTETLAANPPCVGSLRLEDRTVPDADPAALAADPGIRGAVYRELKPALESADPREREVAIRALRYALRAITGERV